MPNLDAALSALLDHAIDGTTIERSQLEQIFGDEIVSLNATDMSCIRTEIGRVAHLPRSTIIELIKGVLSRGVEEFVAIIRGKSIAIEELFSCVALEEPFPLNVRSAFGILSSMHELALRRAVESGVFTKEDALASYLDGDEVGNRIGAFRNSTVQLKYCTGDFQGMPLSPCSPVGVHFNECIQVDTKSKPLNILASNASELWQLSHLEADTIDWLDNSITKGSFFIDVGANIGIYSLYAANLESDVRVVAFEPSPFNFERLCTNIQLNDSSEIAAYPLAISDKSEISTFGLVHAIPGGWGHSGLGPPKTTDSLRVGCATISLDEFMDQIDWSLSPTHMKIDVDGIESRVVAGALRLLAQPSLRHLLIETTEASGAEIQPILESLGFRLLNERAKGFCNRLYKKLPDTIHS